MPAPLLLHQPAPGRANASRSPALAVAGLHLVGSLMFAVAMWRSEAQSLTVAAGLTAYLLGVRHAFDADHIVAIDNTTRFLRAQERPAGAVGFWFALGHSSVVFIACVLLGIGWKSLVDHLPHTDPATGAVAGLWGAAVSGTFLVALALINARILRDLWRTRSVTTGGLHTRGFISSMLGNRLRITRPVQMIVVGFLFGLGFDTATSVGLLLLSAGGQQTALSWSSFVALPVLFTAGMTLFDSANGSVMNRAYGWADADQRRLRYNLTVTAITVITAATVGLMAWSRLVDALLG